MKIDGVEISDYSKDLAFKEVIKDMNKLIDKYYKSANSSAEKKEEVVYYKGVPFYSEKEALEYYGCTGITFRRYEIITKQLEDIKEYNSHLNEDKKFALHLLKNIKSWLSEEAYGLTKDSKYLIK